jgi:hypothetical protein
VGRRTTSWLAPELLGAVSGQRTDFIHGSKSLLSFVLSSVLAFLGTLRCSNPVRCNWLTRFVQVAKVIVMFPSWTSSPFRIRVASLIVNGNTVISDIHPIFWNVPETSKVNEIMTRTR